MALLTTSQVSIYSDGIFSDPKIAHPEGVAIDSKGNLWCGTENGDLLTIDPETRKPILRGSTHGFLLGLQFDSTDTCYFCDLAHQSVFTYKETKIQEFVPKGVIRIPNYPLVDEKRGFLYVSDSFSGSEPGIGLFKFDLKTGKGGACSTEKLSFANGLAMDDTYLYVVESNASRISKFEIRSDGTLSERQDFLNNISIVPDGLCFLGSKLFISCYEPSIIYVYDFVKETFEVLVHDERATLLAHPTNIAISGSTMYTANLGRWHISAIDISTVIG